MSLLNLVEQQATKYGWLSLSSLYFDNGYVINVYNTNGYIAASKDMECFFTLNPLDSTDTEIIEHSHVRMPYGYISMQHNVTASRFEDLQHTDFAMYAHKRFYTDLIGTETTIPTPKYPDSTVLDGYVFDENLGLYTNSDVAVGKDDSGVSVIPVYDGSVFPYVGADIEGWKLFNHTQEKFKAYIKSLFGAIDVF